VVATEDLVLAAWAMLTEVNDLIGSGRDNVIVVEQVASSRRAGHQPGRR
jgi:hypothetical protein